MFTANPKAKSKFTCKSQGKVRIHPQIPRQSTISPANPKTKCKFTRKSQGKVRVRRESPDKVQIHVQIPRQTANPKTNCKLTHKSQGKMQIHPQIPRQSANSSANPRAKSEVLEKSRNLRWPPKLRRVAETIQQNGPRKLILGCFGASLGWGSGLRFQNGPKSHNTQQIHVKPIKYEANP